MRKVQQRDDWSPVEMSPVPNETHVRSQYGPTHMCQTQTLGYCGDDGDLKILKG